MGEGWGEEGIVMVFGTDMLYTATFKMNNQQGLYSRGNSVQYYVTKGENWKRVGTCICITELLCCTPETITTLLINYPLT